MKKKLVIAILMALIVLTGIVQVYAQTEYESVKAQVVEDKGTQEVKQEDGTTKKTQSTEVRILEGEYENEEYEMEYVLTDDVESVNAKPDLKENDSVIVNIQEKDGEISSIQVQDIVRHNYIIYMGIIFLVLILIIGRKKAIRPILIFLIIVATVYFIFITNIQEGANIILMSVITSFIITLATSVIINGFNKKMLMVVICAIIEIGISGIFVYVLFDILKLSGEMMNVEISNISINIKSLVCSGAIITCSGVCTMLAGLIINYLENIKKADQGITVRALFICGLDKGMDIITKIIGILVLLYLCGAPTLVTFITEEGFNNETVLTIISYLFIVSISAVITVPVASIIYSVLNKNKMFYKVKSDNIIKGQRSLKL